MPASHPSQSHPLPGTLRLFVALPLPDAVRQTLRRVQAHLRQRDARSTVRWVEAAHWHLTLQFLGDTPSDALSAISGALAPIAWQTAPFALHLDRGGCFPHPQRPRVFWVGLEGELSPLYFMQRQVSSALAPWCGRAEPFQPHVTVGRVRTSQRGKPNEAAGEIATFLSQVLISPTSWEVSHFDLMKSHLTPEGALYTRVASFDLGQMR